MESKGKEWENEKEGIDASELANLSKLDVFQHSKHSCKIFPGLLIHL